MRRGKSSSAASVSKTSSLTDPNCPIDTNQIKRALRVIPTRRKFSWVIAWFFSLELGGRPSARASIFREHRVTAGRSNWAAAISISAVVFSLLVLVHRYYAPQRWVFVFGPASQFCYGLVNADCLKCGSCGWSLSLHGVQKLRKLPLQV